MHQLPHARHGQLREFCFHPVPRQRGLRYSAGLPHLEDPRRSRGQDPQPSRRQGSKLQGWRLALTKKDGKPYIDLMWSCGRTSWGDPDLAQTGGCHSPAQSSFQGTPLHEPAHDLRQGRDLADPREVRTCRSRSHPQGAGPDAHQEPAGEGPKSPGPADGQPGPGHRAIRQEGWLLGVHAPTFTTARCKRRRCSSRAPRHPERERQSFSETAGATRANPQMKEAGRCPASFIPSVLLRG